MTCPYRSDALSGKNHLGTNWLSRGWLGIFPFLILVSYCLLSLTSFFLADQRELINNFEDDSYYYFTIARHLAEEGNLTFDGHTLANGYHPLWMGVVIPFFMVFDDPILVLRAVGIFSTLAAFLTGALSLRYLSTHFSLLATFLGASLLLACLIAFGSTGMETTILLPMIVVALVYLDRIKPWSSLKPANRDALWLGSILALVQLARLDAVLLSFTILACLVLTIPPSTKKWQFLLLLALPPFVTGICYLALNQILFGHLMPTSGMAKMMGPVGLNFGFIEQLTNSMNPEGTLWNVYAFMLILALGAFTVLLVKGVHSRRFNPVEGQVIPFIVSAFFIMYTIFELLNTSWVLWRWYTYPVLLMAVFVLPFATDGLLHSLEARQGMDRALRLIRGTLFIVIFLFLLFAGIRYGYWRKPVSLLYTYENYRLAEELNDRFTAPAIVGMGDRAGSFGYFFEGDVLQLEGLVGDYEILQAIESNQLSNYMEDFGVDYVLTHAGPSPGYSHWTLLTPLPRHSSGPHAEIELCERSELLRRKFQTDQIVLWEWPGCE